MKTYIPQTLRDNMECELCFNKAVYHTVDGHHYCEECIVDELVDVKVVL